MTQWLQTLRDFLLGEPLPEDGGGIHTQWVRLAEWTRPEQALVLGMVLVVLGLSVWNLRRVAGLRRRAGLLGLRLLVVAVLLYAFYQPALLEERRARSTNAVVLLADDSASMTLQHSDRTRRDVLSAFLRDNEPVFRGLEKTNVVEGYRFSDELVSADWRELAAGLTGRGERTTIVEVLESLQERYRNRDIGGIVLLSDGIDNGRAARTLGGGNELDRETRRLLESFGAPIHTFGFPGAEIRDVSVHELRYSPFAFKRNQSTIEAEIQVHGYDSGELVVELLEEGRLVRSVTRAVERGVLRYTASFDFTPTELGHRVYAVRVRPFPGEVTLENNERFAVVNVNRDKIRVLQICGHPSWDVRFVRNHLKRTPNIQLISFFILIEGTWMRRVPSGETALIPFPAEDLFVNELGSFDLVILQDFNYGPFDTRQHLFRIRDYVQQGGAVLMIGGRKSLGEGEYTGTELAEVLPVDMVDRDDHPAGALDSSEYTARLSEAGTSHTITRLAFDPATNGQVWESMPALEGINLSRGLARGGISLLDHPKLRMEDGRPMPVLAVAEPDEGRSAVVATDSFWRYAMPNAGGGGDDRHYDTLQRNLIRWLIRDPELDLVRVQPSNGVRDLGESVDLDVRVFEPDYRPSVDHPFRLEIRRRTDAADRENGEVVHDPADLRTDALGRHAMTWTATRPGIYDVIVRSAVAGRQLVGRTVFVVSDERPEMRRVIDTDNLLLALSRATGGLSGRLEDRIASLPLNPPRVSDVTSRRYHERWNVPGVFVLACLLLALEWWLRRRAGLL